MDDFEKVSQTMIGDDFDPCWVLCFHRSHPLRYLQLQAKAGKNKQKWHQERNNE